MKKLPIWLRWVCGGLIVIGLISLVVIYWEWFSTEPCGMESRSTTARNVGILFFGLFAIGFAIWRGIVANRQAKASQQQAETSQRGLLNERYQKGAEMLGSDVLSVRLGGIYALQRLSRNDQDQHDIQIMRLFCAFVRHPTEDKTLNQERVREDVEVTLKAIITCRGSSLDRLSLINAKLPKANLVGANLANVDLFNAKLSNANLADANLTKADLASGDLTNAKLPKADLTGADLNRVILTGTVLSEAKGLTQGQLALAVADSDNPPKLDDARDAQTNNPLRWEGGEPPRNY